METLPVEIVEKIFGQILWKNPGDFYQLRTVSKTWKSIIDQCARRLLHLWCNKCKNEIAEVYLDDMIRTRYPRFPTWQEYCSNGLIMPHIAKDIYESRNEFPNVVHNKVCLTEICTQPKFEYTSIYTYAINDDYLAISWLAEEPIEDDMSVVRVYSINDLDHYIREYSIASKKIDFYSVNNRVFLILLEDEEHHYFGEKSVYTSEFLMNDSLIPSELRLSSCDINYVITNNQCFTYDEEDNWIQHYRLTPSGFKLNTRVRVPNAGYKKSTKITKVQICNDKLFVSVVPTRKKSANLKIKVYQYQITRRSYNKLLFSVVPEIYYQKIAAPSYADSSAEACELLQIDFALDSTPLQDRLCDLHHDKLTDWVEKFFQTSFLDLITVYAHHLLIKCEDGFIMFRGNLAQLMDNVVKGFNLYSKCTFIDLEANDMFPIDEEYSVSIIRNECKPKFLLICHKKVFLIDLVL